MLIKEESCIKLNRSIIQDWSPFCQLFQSENEIFYLQQIQWLLMGTTSRKCPKVQPITMVKLAKMLQQKITNLHKPTDLQNVFFRHFSFPSHFLSTGTFLLAKLTQSLICCTEASSPIWNDVCVDLNHVRLPYMIFVDPLACLSRTRQVFA